MQPVKMPSMTGWKPIPIQTGADTQPAVTTDSFAHAEVQAISLEHQIRLPRLMMLQRR